MTRDGTALGSPRAELALLCQSCGLCCDGSLFGRVDLDGEEVDSARRGLLSVASGEKSFAQPCPALVSCGSGVRCSIYDERPSHCRRFACKLYDRHAREGGPVDARLAVARRVRLLVASLEASGLGTADFEAARCSDPLAHPAAVAALPTYLELTRTLEDDFSRAP